MRLEPFGIAALVLGLLGMVWALVVMCWAQWISSRQCKCHYPRSPFHVYEPGHAHIDGEVCGGS